MKYFDYTHAQKTITFLHRIIAGLVVAIAFIIGGSLIAIVLLTAEVDELESTNNALMRHQLEINAENEWLKDQIDVLEGEEQ